MDKQQKLKIALTILFIVMAFVWGPIIFGSGSKQKADNNTGGINKPLGENTSNFGFALPQPGNQKKARTTYAQWGQNPFMLKRAPKALYIEGIMWDENSPRAIINGNIISIGDSIESKTIVDIKPNSVIISGGDGVVELRLNE